MLMRIEDIFQYLPHRYPFLLIDRVTELKEMEYLKGYKNVTFNEPQFTGHFPNHPIMPGVMIIEAMAQATGILAFKSSEKSQTATLFIISLVLIIAVFVSQPFQVIV